jgi:hypothetical protein
LYERRIDKDRENREKVIIKSLSFSPRLLFLFETDVDDKDENYNKDKKEEEEP